MIKKFSNFQLCKKSYFLQTNPKNRLCPFEENSCFMGFWPCAKKQLFFIYLKFIKNQRFLQTCGLCPQVILTFNFWFLTLYNILYIIVLVAYVKIKEILINSGDKTQAPNHCFFLFKINVSLKLKTGGDTNGKPKQKQSYT